MYKAVHEQETGLEFFCNVLLEEGVSETFQPQGELLFKTNSAIKQFQLTHEQAVIHAADGYSRATGKTGIAFIKANYGLTNAVTGIGTAQLDSVPLVVFVQHTTNDREQQLDVEGITKAVAKYNFSVQTISELASITTQAVKIAAGGRPGVVVIDYAAEIFEENIQQGQQMQNERVKLPRCKEVPKHVISKVVSALHQAQKPVLLVGGGVVISGASTMLSEFLDRTNMPFASTLMGLGAVETNHPLHLGMIGMHGTFAANRAVHRADLLICLGVRFSDRITGNTKGFSPNSKKIHIDIDPAEINKRVKVDHPVIGDIQNVLTLLNEQILSETNADWTAAATGWSKRSARFHEPKHNLIGPDRIINLLNTYAEANAIIATDVGQHQMWTAHHYPFQLPRRFLTSGGFGTMGYGLPAAIGGAVTSPNQKVVCVSGDGSIQMNIQELMTAVRYKLDIKIAILKNGYLGMVRQWQQLFYKRNYSHVKISSPDYVVLAESFGAKGLRAETAEQAEEIIEAAFQTAGPVVMEFTIEDERNVYPIVPPGGNNTDALNEEIENV